MFSEKIVVVMLSGILLIVAARGLIDRLLNDVDNHVEEAVSTYYSDRDMESLEELSTRNIVVKNVEFIIANGAVCAYLTAEDGNIYKTRFTDGIVSIKQGDEIVLGILPCTYLEGEVIESVIMKQ